MFWKIGNWTISVLSVLIPLLSLIFALIFLLWFSWYRFKRMRAKLAKEVGEAHEVLRKEIKFLKIQLSKHNKILRKKTTKKKISVEEEVAMEEFAKDILLSIEKIDKEISAMEKELK